MTGDLVGVIGGMGPMATADFLAKLTQETPAERDQDHVPVLVWGDPRTPDRTAAILGRGASPEAALIGAAQALERFGAGVLAMPCNTAHAWADVVGGAVQVPLISMIDAVIDEAKHRRVASLGVMATRGTIKAGVYDDPVRAQGLRPVVPDEACQCAIDDAIRSVKAGRLEQARAPLIEAFNALCDAGADAVVLACTEIPVALAPIDPRAIDATRALARAVLRWSQSQERTIQGGRRSDV